MPRLSTVGANPAGWVLAALLVLVDSAAVVVYEGAKYVEETWLWL